MKFKIPKIESKQLNSIIKLLENYRNFLKVESDLQLHAIFKPLIVNNKISIDFIINVEGCELLNIKLFNIETIDLDDDNVILTTCLGEEVYSQTVYVHDLEKEIDKFIQTEEVISALSNLLRLKTFYK